jgi:hypothetical protein
MIRVVEVADEESTSIHVGLPSNKIKCPPYVNVAQYVREYRTKGEF